MNLYYLIIIFLSLILTSQTYAEENLPIELEPVVVTASKIEEPISEVPASIDVITRQELEEKQILTLDEAIQATTGLDITGKGGADPAAHNSIRGTYGKQSAIMIDGLKINPPYDQTPEAGGILMHNIERVEIVKGSYSALYGSEAIGGVVNVITREEPGLSYSVSGGTFKTFNANLLYSNRHKDTFYTLGYERFNTDGFKYSGPYWNNTFMGKLNFHLSPQSTINLSTYYWDWEKYPYATIEPIDEGYENWRFIIDKNIQDKENNWLHSLQLSHSPSERWDYNVRVSMYTLNLLMKNPLDTPTIKTPVPLGWDFDLNSFRDTFEMQHNLRIEEWDTVTAGIQYTFERVETEERYNIDSSDTALSGKETPLLEDRLIRAIYLQNLFKIKDSLSLTAGARFENSPGSYDEWTPRVSGLYVIPITDTSIRISYGQGFRTPNLNEMFHPFMGNYTKGDSDLKPEKGINYEIGIKQPLFRKQVVIEGTVYRIDLKDQISVNDDGIFTNIDNAEIKGIESDLKWNITEGLRAEIGYTRIITKDLATGDPLVGIPNYKWTGDIVYKPFKRLILDINAIYVGESFDPFLEGIIGFDGNPLTNKYDPYKVVNMAASYNIISGSPSPMSLELFIKLNNLFDEKYTSMGDWQNYGFNFLAGIRSTY